MGALTTFSQGSWSHVKSSFRMRGNQLGSLAKLQQSTILQNVPILQFLLLSKFSCKILSNVATFYNHAIIKQGTPVKLVSCEQHLRRQGLQMTNITSLTHISNPSIEAETVVVSVVVTTNSIQTTRVTLTRIGCKSKEFKTNRCREGGVTGVCIHN